MDLNNLVLKMIDAFAEECKSTATIYFGYRITVVSRMYYPKIKATAPYLAKFCSDITGDQFTALISEADEQGRFEIVFDRTRKCRNGRIDSCWYPTGRLKTD